MNKRYHYFLPPIITALILLVVYYIKSIYPFGHHTIMWADMHQINTPLYYYFYDIIINGDSLFYNFKSGLGMNFFGVFFFFLSSPVNLILLLFPRSDIMNAMSVLLLVKMMLISLTAYIFFNYYFKGNKFYKIGFSVLYAFSSYVLILYTNNMWLDNVYLFPLLLLFLKKLYDEDKILGYIILLTMNLIVSFYIAYMILFFIFFSSLLYLHFYVDKEKRGKKIILLGIGTVMALGLSAIVLIPSYLQTKASSRISSSLISNFIGSSDFLLDKISFLFINTIVYAAVILLFTKIKKDKHVKFIGSILVFTLIQIVFDGINKLWHTGSYVYFPLRYGFIPIFFLLILGFYIITTYEIKIKPMTKKIKVYTIIFGIAIIFLSTFYYEKIIQVLAKMNITKSNGEGFFVFFLLLIISLSFISLFIITLKYMKNGKRKAYFISFLFVFEIMINSMFYIGIGEKGIDVEYAHINQVYDNLNDEHIAAVRLKDELFNSNASLIYDMQSNGHYTSLNNENHMRMMKELGYSSYWVRTFDNGGTIFSDSLLGYQYVLSNHHLDDEFYSLVKEVNKDTYLYQYKKTLPVGFFTPEAIQTVKLDDQSVFSYQNLIYQALADNDKEIITEYQSFTYDNILKTEKDGMINLEKIDKDKDASLTITIQTNKDKLLYLNILKSLNNNVNKGIYYKFRVSVNGIPIDLQIPTYKYISTHKKQVDQDIFPQRLQNGLLELGRFDGNVTVKLDLLKDCEYKELSIGALDLNLFQDFVNNYQSKENIILKGNKITANIDTDKSQLFSLSIPYDKGWKLSVNGKETELKQVMGNFMGIPLNEGHNKIEMIYYPPGLKLGAMISFLFFSLTLVGILFRHALRKVNFNFFKYVYYGFMGIYAFGILFVYIMPIFIQIFRYFFV